MYVRNLFKEVKTIVAEAAASTTVVAGVGNISFIESSGGNVPMRFEVTSGIVYISTLSTDPTIATALVMTTANTPIDLQCGYIAMLSTSTSATRQAIIFKD